jgi:branched-chain amino acid transport system substrate-binding protein
MNRPSRVLRHSPTRSRATLATVGVVTVSLLLAACGGGDSGGGSSGESGGTVDVGFLNTFGVPASVQAATDQYEGAELGVKYVEAHGGLYNGATIALKKGNESGEPALVASTVRTMTNDGINLIIGPTLTPDCLAAAPLIDQAGAVSLVGCTTTSVTGADRAGKNLYRWDTNDFITSTALGLEIAKDYSDVQAVDVVAYDYLQGHEGWETFQNTLADKGLKPTTEHEFFVPSGTTNYSAQVGALAQTPKDGKKRVLVLLTWGAGYLNFLKQAIPLGVLDNYEAVVTTSMYYASAKALAGTAPDIWNSYGTCHADLWDNDIMAWLKDEMQKAHQRLPDDWSTVAFNQVLIMAAAINKATSTDPAKVNEAMASLQVDTATGPMTMDPDTHQAQRQAPVCQTVGDPSAPEGVKLVGGTILSPSDTAG